MHVPIKINYRQQLFQTPGFSGENDQMMGPGDPVWEDVGRAQLHLQRFAHLSRRDPVQCRGEAEEW